MDNHSHRIACVLGPITVCCGGEKDTALPSDGNTPPEVYITSRAEGVSAFDQQEVDMAGLVSDLEDDTEALRVSWALGGTVVRPEKRRQRPMARPLAASRLTTMALARSA